MENIAVLVQEIVLLRREGNYTVLSTSIHGRNGGIQHYRVTPPVIVIDTDSVLPVETGNPSQNDERNQLQEAMDYIPDALPD